jgi:integrase
VATLWQVSRSIPPTIGFIFSSKTNTARHFSGWSKSKIALDKKLGPNVKAWTLHDLRRTFATNLAIHITEKLLNHVSGTTGGLVAVYQRHAYFDEIRDAMNLGRRGSPLFSILEDCHICLAT